MTTETVERVAAGQPVELNPAADERVAAAWRTITAITAERPVYGRTTGVGANREVAISPDEQPAHGRRLIDSHATALGPLLPPALVRAMIGVRVNQLAAGGSGISPEVVTALVRLLASDTVPDVRDGGSIGTGDLPALGQIARALDVELAGGDALALMSSNALTLARAALGSASLLRLAHAGLAVAALTVRAADGNLEAFCETVHAARPHDGQQAAAAAIRRLLEPAGSWKAARVQDNYGLRAAAQVAGPLLDAAARLERTLSIELNAVAENPMVDVSGRRVLHNANFHLAALALDLDAARVALYQAAALSVARLAELMDPGTTGRAPFLAGEPVGSSGALGLEYVAHAELARLA